MLNTTKILCALGLCCSVGCGDNTTGTTSVAGTGADSGSASASSSGAATTATTMTTTAETTMTTADSTSTSATTMTTAPMTSTSSTDMGDTDGSSTGDTNLGFSFFVTSAGSGAAGGNLGGLAGADAMCQDLAETAGSTRTWRAYLSSSAEAARDRIGDGPWLNTAMQMVAADNDALHRIGLAGGDPQLVLDENGVQLPGGEHDILTGSGADGTLSGGACQDWTSNDPGDQCRLGHGDFGGSSSSWNDAHNSQGCDEQSLINSAGSGRLYCFAID